jgi:hypothetical protein
MAGSETKHRRHQKLLRLLLIFCNSATSWTNWLPVVQIGAESGLPEHFCVSCVCLAMAIHRAGRQ